MVTQPTGTFLSKVITMIQACKKIQIKTNNYSDIDAINVYTLGFYDNLD